MRLFILASIVLLSGCITKVRRGYVFDQKSQENMKQISIGSNTKNDIIFLLGTPSFTVMPEGNAVFYASDIGIRIASLGDIIYKRRIVRYNFDDEGKLISLDNYTLLDRKFIIRKKIKVIIKKPNNFFSLPFYKLI